MPRGPVHHEGSKNLETGNSFLTVKWPPSHAIYRKYVTCHLPYSDALLVLIDALRVAKEPNVARSQSPWRWHQQFCNQETDCQPVGAISCMQLAVSKLQLAKQKLVLSSRPSSSSVLANNRIHTVIVADILVRICWQLTKCKGLSEIAYK